MLDSHDKLTTIAAAASDILRWVLQMALTQRISTDRRLDIYQAAERIIKVVREL